MSIDKFLLKQIAYLYQGFSNRLQTDFNLMGDKRDRVLSYFGTANKFLKMPKGVNKLWDLLLKPRDELEKIIKRLLKEKDDMGEGEDDDQPIDDIIPDYEPVIDTNVVNQLGLHKEAGQLSKGQITTAEWNNIVASFAQADIDTKQSWIDRIKKGKS